MNEAVLKACAWRGRCINLFARAEAAVTDRLKADGRAVRPAMGFRQRLGMLCETAPEKLRDRLEAVELLLVARTALTHGRAEIGVQRDGWLLVLAHDNGADCVLTAFTEAQAEQFRKDLHRAVQRLEQAVAPSSQTPGRAGTPCA